MKLNASQLRRVTGSTLRPRPSILKKDIYIILDNVLDTYNIGSIFRLADAVGAKKVFLCAGSATPPNPRIKKASINTTEVVDWEYCETATLAISNIKSLISNIQVIAIEQAKGSVPYDKFKYKLPVALVVGHESFGINQETLALCDGVVEIPMFGVNISLNVMVSLVIVLYQLLES